jgi:hypothetical protein
VPATRLAAVAALAKILLGKHDVFAFAIKIFAFDELFLWLFAH